MKTAIILIILLHGLIHLMGFAKAFNLAEINELTLPISPGWGLIWMIAALTLILSGVLWMLNMSLWWIPAIIGVILSQILVFVFWQDARFGSLPNLIILIFIVSGFVRYTPPVSMVEDGFKTASFEERYDASRPVVDSAIINPFYIAIQPMERLLLINIENDPDSLYIGFEPQIFDDEITGTGMLVIAWRVDGKVDVYHQPTLKPDPAGYDITGQGLENMVVRELQDAFFEVNETGAHMAASFKDIEGRLIELNLEERSTRTRKPFGLLAPMGMAAENPSSMPMVLLHDFYFVRKNDTDLSVKIDGRIHKPDNLPLPIDFSRMTFSRYSPDPLIAKLNPSHNGVLTAIPSNEELSFQYDDHKFELVMNRNIAEIQRIKRNQKQHSISLAFNPAFPNLNAFAGDSTSGQFEITGDPSTGYIRGEYKVIRSNDRITIEMIPSDGWIPNDSKLSLRFLYSVQPMFKQWPTTYRWKAELYKDEYNQMKMNSKWVRIK